MATNNANNNATPNVAAHSVLISEAGSPVVGVLLATGQVLVGVTGADPVAQTLANVNKWVDQTTGSVTMAINTGYVTDNGASLVTYTLPTTAALGSVMEIVGQSAGGWTVAQASGQSIGLGSQVSTTGAGGSISSSNAGDCVRIVCVTANTTFRVVSGWGNITFV
jgi:hypothetical protein